MVTHYQKILVVKCHTWYARTNSCVLKNIEVDESRYIFTAVSCGKYHQINFFRSKILIRAKHMYITTRQAKQIEIINGLGFFNFFFLRLFLHNYTVFKVFDTRVNAYFIFKLQSNIQKVRVKLLKLEPNSLKTKVLKPVPVSWVLSRRRAGTAGTPPLWWWWRHRPGRRWLAVGLPLTHLIIARNLFMEFNGKVKCTV